MNADAVPASRAAVQRVVEAINEVWRTESPEAIGPLLDPYFADDITIAGPGFSTMGAGRDAAVQSYVDFARGASITAFEMVTPEIHVDGGTAVATYSWRIRYVMDGAEFDESGHDVIVLRLDGERWLATWRAMLPDPQ